MYDFGFVALDILYTYPEDSGIYMCKATNRYGSDINQVQLRCLGTMFHCHYCIVSVNPYYFIIFPIRLFLTIRLCRIVLEFIHSFVNGLAILNGEICLL